MRDLIFVSLENWDEIWRRNQFVCAELARRFPQRKILFVGRPLFPPDLIKGARSKDNRGAIKNALLHRFRKVPQFPNIWVFNPIKPLPNPVPGGRAFNDASISAQIRRVARRTRMRDPLLWVNPWYSGHLIGQLEERGVIYDITDDWELAAPTPKVRQDIANLDRNLCRRADLTIVCSQALYNGRQNVARRLFLLPNGVDAAHYARMDALGERAAGHFNAQGAFQPSQGKASDSIMEQKTAVEAWPRPVFGYTGSLSRDRIDLDLVLKLARAHPHGSVVLIGPHHWGADAPRKLIEAEPNIYAPGPVPYARIPEVMAHFDVCIVPHRRSEFVESLNPIKLWEYLACGKPIVATDVAGFRDFPDLVYLAKDAPEFIQCCRHALGEINCQSPPGEKDFPADWPNSPPLSQERRSEAAKHSWCTRVDALLAEWRTLGLIAPEN